MLLFINIYKFPSYVNLLYYEFNYKDLLLNLPNYGEMKPKYSKKKSNSALFTAID